MKVWQLRNCCAWIAALGMAASAALGAGPAPVEVSLEEGSLRLTREGAALPMAAGESLQDRVLWVRLPEGAERRAAARHALDRAILEDAAALVYLSSGDSVRADLPLPEIAAWGRPVLLVVAGGAWSICEDEGAANLSILTAGNASRSAMLGVDPADPSVFAFRLRRPRPTSAPALVAAALPPPPAPEAPIAPPPAPAGAAAPAPNPLKEPLAASEWGLEKLLDGVALLSDKTMDFVLGSKLVERIERMNPLRGWNSKITCGLGAQQGALNQMDAAIRFESRRDFPGGRALKWEAGHDFARQSEGGARRTTLDRFSANLRYRREWRDRLFFQTYSRYVTDGVREVDHDLEQSAGLGWRFLRLRRLTANIVPSLTVRWRQDGRGEDTRLMYALFQEGRYRLSERITLVETADFAWDSGSSGEMRMTLAGIGEVKITPRTSANLRLEMIRDEAVPVTVPRTQQRAILGYGLEF